MTNSKQEVIFWNAVNILNKIDVLPHIMVIGSWAEYLYTQIFSDNFIPNIHTKDIDLLYRDIRKPSQKIPFVELMRENGFSYDEIPNNGVAKFYKEGLIELEFLTQIKGSGAQSINSINSLGIKSEGLRDINILNRYPYSLEIKNITIIVPEPAAYIIQKLLTNPTRVPAYKKEKDILAIKELLPHIQNNKYHSQKLNEIINDLTNKKIKIIRVDYLARIMLSTMF